MRSPLSLEELLPSGGVWALHNRRCRAVWAGAGRDLRQESKQWLSPETRTRKQKSAPHDALTEVVWVSHNWKQIMDKGDKKIVYVFFYIKQYCEVKSSSFQSSLWQTDVNNLTPGAAKCAVKTLECWETHKTLQYSIRQRPWVIHCPCLNKTVNEGQTKRRKVSMFYSLTQSEIKPCWNTPPPLFIPGAECCGALMDFATRAHLWVVWRCNYAGNGSASAKWMHQQKRKWSYTRPQQCAAWQV